MEGQIFTIHCRMGVNPPIAKFQGRGDSKVERLGHDEEEKHIYISQAQYFEGITKEVRQYQIGDYQVLNKWLKDRKGERLSLEDIKHYCKVVTSLQKTIEIQQEIDNIYSEIERKLIMSYNFCEFTW